MKYFLGLAANYSGEDVVRHTFAVGRESDRKVLTQYLSERYGGEAILCKNGRSALALALKAYFDRGDAVLVNGFTCYAVYEAVRAAGLTPIWVDITREDLNFSIETLATATLANSRLAPKSHIRGIVVQNTLGNPVDIAKIEKFARERDLTIIEDLAHSTGVRYPDGREAGTVGAAAVLSFGKEKSIDTVSGGAVVLRELCKHEIKVPSNLPRPSDHMRARFYPLFGAICRGLTYLHLGGVLMRGLLKIHWVERSADNKLDLKRKISKFEARIALRQLKSLKKFGEPPIREFYLVDDRETVLRELTQAGYYFSGLWYEKPVSPERYYKKVHFPEENCPNATYVAQHIVNLPTYYSKSDLEKARKIIKKHLAVAEGKHE